MTSPLTSPLTSPHACGTSCEPLSNGHDQDSKTAKEVDYATHIYLRNLAGLVSSRLPKALPPYAADPTFFATGLLFFVPLFSRIKNQWSRLHPDGHGPAPNSLSPILQPCIAVILKREQDIIIDIQDLCGWSDVDLQRELAAMSEETFIGELEKQMDAELDGPTASQEASLLGYCYSILQTLLLLSENLRPKLAAPSEEFWQKRCSSLRPLSTGLGSIRTAHVRKQPIFASCIPADKVSERQKALFNTLADADALLNHDNIDNIARVARAAKWMAQSMIRITQELDMLCFELDPCKASGASNCSSYTESGGKKKGHPRRAARDSVQLMREQKWCTEGLKELGLRKDYDLQAEGRDEMMIGPSSVPRGASADPYKPQLSPVLAAAAAVADSTTTSRGTSPQRARLVKFGVMPKKEE